MNEIKVSFDRYCLTSKPNKGDATWVSDRIADCIKTINHDNIKSFAKMVGENGQTFCPATFSDGIRSRENFKQAQLCALDFVKGISFEEVKNRAERYELPILFAYRMLSSSDNSQFSIVFLNDVSIPASKVSEVTQQALLTIFPEADPACKDISKMYFGGKRLLHFDESVPKINIESLFRNLPLYLRNRYGATNYMRKIAEFSKATSIALNGRNLPDVTLMEDLTEDIDSKFNKNSPNSSIVYEVPCGENLLNRSYVIKFADSTSSSIKETKKSTIHLPCRSSILRDISSNCLLFQEFESGSRKLPHDELLSMATNLVQVESGAKKFKDILKSNSYFDNLLEKYADWEYYLSYFKSYNPISCNSFCPYKDTCSHGTNILSTSKIKYHQIEKLSNYDEDLVSIEEAEKDLEREINNAMESDKKMWYIIKAQTAIGKTESYLKFVRDTSQIVLIVVPTIKLKQEVYERAKKMGIKIIESPSLRQIKDDLPDDVWSHIENLYNSGRSVIPYLKKVIKENNPECTKLFKQYLEELEAFNNFNGHAITTHKRLLTMDVSKYDIIIIDEDIIFNSIIPNKTDITVSDLKKIKKKIAPGSAISKKIHQVLKYIKTEKFFTLSEIDYDKADDGIPVGIDIPSFCLAKHFCFRKESDKENNLSEDCISFLNPVDFKKNVKYIMLSATVDETVCEYYFGKGNIKFSECRRAKNTGTLNQYYDKSMSRAYIDKYLDVIKRIKKWSGFKHTITFMKYLLDGLHYGNTAGCDYMKGENIDVIGTPHQPEWIYKLFAYSTGIDFDETAKMRYQKVEHNGVRFWFTTFKDEILKAIQFYMVESELEQAVGRARLLRKKCAVNLFSNFPLRQANLMKSEYEESLEDKN